MQIVILLYPDMTALDAIGPYEVLARLPEATLTFAASWSNRPGRIDIGPASGANSNSASRA